MSLEPHFPSQQKVDDLVRDLGLTKSNAELLTSRLKEWNLLDTSCQCSSSRKRHERFSKYFSMVGSLCFCNNVDNVFEELGIVHDPKEWHLFIDSSSRNLKCVLLYNGNHYPSIPIGHSAQMKEDYNNVKFVLENINYTRYNWSLCGDFKMIGFLKGLQGGDAKYSCFLFYGTPELLLNTTPKKNGLREGAFVPGTQNVKHDPLVDLEKILLPPLHIKLGLVKQFIKAMNKDGDGFQHISALFPFLSEAKKKAGIVTGPQVPQCCNVKNLKTK